MGRALNLELPVSVPDNMPHVGTAKAWLHVVQVVTTFLTICVVAPIIATENRFYGGSQPGPNWTLVVAIMSIVIPICLVYFPWAYDRQSKFKKLGKFFLKPRTNLIFTSFYSVLWATASISITVHSNNPVHCNFDSALQKKYGDSYMSAWATQCNLAKATAGFAWITCLMWVATLLCTLVIFWSEKQSVRNNLREHEMNKQMALNMQQEEEARQYQSAHKDYYREEESDLGGGRPQSFEQARPLQAPVPPAHHASPFESPYDPPVGAEQPQQSYYHAPSAPPQPMPEQTDYAYQEYHQRTPEQAHMIQQQPYQNTPPVSYTPMPMPEPSAYAQQQQAHHF
ncbi:hypothetical protein EC973_001995 [Apophysomyces ossiformis]|uniref:MARVEL domain-containing protein n=1 Tax=Apophysomyces ossiformis TaxID=679940 RepID=A0A8H7BJN4_9FUNG|nr:hypothetical protein EC973_001995 [Apophysomyces ossiformis]